MEFFEVVKMRQSVRAYQPKPIEEAKLQAILEAANRAPSAGNLQAYRIVVVKDTKLRQAMAQAAVDQGFIAEAPCVLVFCAEPRRAAGRYGVRGGELYCVQDATIACAYAQLAATAQGLASVWVGAFEESEVRRILGLEKGLKAIALLPIGYPAESPEPTPRRKLSDLVQQKFGDGSIFE